MHFNKRWFIATAAALLGGWVLPRPASAAANTFSITNATLTINAAGFTTTGNFAISAGSVAVNTSTPVVIGGSWTVTNNGVFSAGNSTVTFNGTTSALNINTGGNPFYCV